LRLGLWAKKSRGQHFLTDPAALARIVAAAEISPDDVVVEVGAGLGALTLLLAEAAAHVVAIERDPGLAHELAVELGERKNVGIAACDALGFDFAHAAAQARRPLVVVGNLPYQITSPLLFKLIEDARRGLVIARAVIMVQREVAQRMTAAPGGRIYGRLSVMVQQYADVAILFHVGAGAFFPRPRVTSSVLRLTPREAPRAAVQDQALFERVVRAAFGTRRKMLRRALSPAFGEGQVARALERAAVEGRRRAEELDIADFGRLCDALGHGGQEQVTTCGRRDVLP
jgi:16S rRNA (adenine1518-N6/adenine1519-N6)-dimethyltransferase